MAQPGYMSKNMVFPWLKSKKYTKFCQMFGVSTSHAQILCQIMKALMYISHQECDAIEEKEGARERQTAREKDRKTVRRIFGVQRVVRTWYDANNQKHYVGKC